MHTWLVSTSAKIYAPIMLAAVLFLCTANISAEQQEDQTSKQPSVEELQQVIKLLHNTIAKQNNDTKLILQRLQLLEKKVTDLTAQVHPNTPTDPTAPKQHDLELAKKIEAERVENTRLIETAFEQKLIATGGLLMQPGKFSYDPSFSYVHSSVDRIIIDGFALLPILIVGDIVSEQVRRDIMTINNTFRVGIPKDFQFEIQVPYGYENQRITRGDGQQEEGRTSGFGDVSLSLSHQLVKASSFWPDTLISMGWKSTTGQDPYRLVDSNELALGTGFSSTNISLTSVNVSDPLAFYSGIAYTKTSGDRKNIGYIQPGSSVRINTGVSMAINLDTSMSFGFQLSYIDETEFEGSDIPGSDYTTSTLSIGLSRTLSDKTSLEFDVGIGLTQDAPDLQMTVTLPIRIN